jgi:integrase/recombinase XerC
MSGQAKTLDASAERAVLAFVASERSGTMDRDRLALLFSWRAGMRVGEIAGLCWADVCDARGRLSDDIRIRRETTKGKEFTRHVPIHPELKAALHKAHAKGIRLSAPVIAGENNQPMTTNALTVWFWRVYRDAGLDGCSSHSGRRTFITRAARRCTEVGASIEDVRRMAGHAFLSTTAGYIDPNHDAKRALVAVI